MKTGKSGLADDGYKDGSVHLIRRWLTKNFGSISCL